MANLTLPNQYGSANRIGILNHNGSKKGMDTRKSEKKKKKKRFSTHQDEEAYN